MPIPSLMPKFMLNPNATGVATFVESLVILVDPDIVVTALPDDAIQLVQDASVIIVDVD